MGMSSRVALARRRRGITKSDLAEAVGVTPRSIQGFEAGEIQPSADTLTKLSQVLEFPVSFFEGVDLEPIPDDAVSFRAMSKMKASQRHAALGAGALALALNDWITDRFKLPDPDIPRFEQTLDPETAAQTLRAEWGLGEKPISNVLHLLEAHGARVFSLAEDCREVDAFSFWRRGVPFALLNTKKSAERRRFDAAHELGHLTMHGLAALPHGRAAEDQANRFASAFLMPRSLVIARFPRVSGVEDLFALKRYLKVSVAALAYRAHELGLLSEWRYRSLCVEIAERGFRMNEPKSLQPETSQVLNKVLAAVRVDGVSKSDLADDLHLYPADLDALMFDLALVPVEGGRSVSAARNRNEQQLEVLQGGANRPKGSR